MKNRNLREKIGQMIMTGYPSVEPSPEIISLIEDYKVANIILFSYNLQSIEQIRQSCRELHQRIERSTGYPGFIAVDQEGGVVTRLPKEACNVPGAMLIGATGKKEYAYQAGRITGEELKALGINMDLAPVLDVNSNPDNPVIGVRSYSSDPNLVKEYGVQMMKGLLSAGTMAVIKHFPGHGDTAVDSHLGLPIVEKTLEEMLECELVPFQSAIHQGAPCVMTSHILFPKLEPEKKPATMSKSILTGLLRQRLGFEGVIITDCLEMSAIKNFYGTAEGAVEAVKAGAQLLCISHTPALVIETIHRLEAAVEAGEISMKVIDQAVENILRLKEKYKVDYSEDTADCIGSAEHKKRTNEMIRQGITKVTKKELPDISTDTVFIGSYAYRSTLANSAADYGLHFAKYMSKKLQCRYLDIPVNPDTKEIQEILSELRNSSYVIYGLYNGHLNQGQIALARELHKIDCELLAVALRNPYDLSLLSEDIHKIAAYEYNIPVFEALLQIIKKEAAAGGKIPVLAKQENGTA